MNTKEKIKQYLNANVHDGEDRKGCHCDRAVFTPDELQELVEEACEYALKEEKPKTIDFTQMPVDTLVRKADGMPAYTAKILHGTKSYVYADGKDSKTAETKVIIGLLAPSKCSLMEGRKVVWEGGECPLPDGVEVEVGFRFGVSVTCNCTSSIIGVHGWFHTGEARDVIWYKITGRMA